MIDWKLRNEQREAAEARGNPDNFEAAEQRTLDNQEHRRLLWKLFRGRPKRSTIS